MSGRVYVTVVSHLDTQWRWTVRDTIRLHLPRTLQENFAAFARPPAYVVSFDGAFRYALMQEYYPREFAELKRHVQEGRWALAGAFWDAADVNIPSPESLMRQVLYGSGFFQREFGRRPREVFLPDCFGFGWALPSIAAHCGLTSFSSQKLSRGRAAGEIPFDLGVWTGPDGSELLTALPLYGYGKPFPKEFPDRDTLAALDRQEKVSGLRRVMSYYGVGDRGGALGEESIAGLARATAKGDPSVILDGPGRWASDLTAAERASLPRHGGELLLGVHATGCYTSQAAMKRWNRKNEQLADAAERAACAAHWLSGLSFPRETLREAWRRFLWHQFHDDVTGTSIPAAYDISWNDEALSLNQFADVLEASLGAVSSGLDTRAQGVPIVVFNPLGREREDVVEARLAFDVPTPRSLRVFGPDGAEVPAQASVGSDGAVELVFLARVAPLGFAVFDARPSEIPCPLDTGLAASTQQLTGPRCRAQLDESGSVASLFDSSLGRELLASPLRLELLPDRSKKFPAWELRYDDVAASPRETVAGPVSARVAEAGPARVAVEVVRRVGRSVFRERLQLGAGGAGDRLEVSTEIDWRARGRLLKARVSCRLDDPVATYDLGLGSIERGVNTPRLYEVPAQQWASLFDRRAGLGVAVVNDCKYGWDRPAPATLRLTLLHTPRAGRRFRDQSGQDRGRHRLLYAVAGHSGDGRRSLPELAARVNQPLRAFRTTTHAGPLGRSWSFLAAPPPGVAVAALKLAEESDELVVRVQETRGEAAAANLTFASRVVAAREVNGAEEPIAGSAVFEGGRLAARLSPHQTRAFAVALAPPQELLPAPRSTPIPVPFDLAVVSFDSDRSAGDFDGRGHSLPGELLEPVVRWSGISFELGPLEGGRANAALCRGQGLALPAEGGSRLYLLAAAAGGEVRCSLSVDGSPRELRVPDWSAEVGRADRRRWGRLVAGFLRRERLAWVGTHRHGPDGDEPYVFCYLFPLRVDLPSGARRVTLPDAPSVRLLAATVVANAHDPAGLLQPIDR